MIKGYALYDFSYFKCIVTCFILFSGQTTIQKYALKKNILQLLDIVFMVFLFCFIFCFLIKIYTVITYIIVTFVPVHDISWFSFFPNHLPSIQLLITSLFTKASFPFFVLFFFYSCPFLLLPLPLPLFSFQFEYFLPVFQ